MAIFKGLSRALIAFAVVGATTIAWAMPKAAPTALTRTAGSYRLVLELLPAEPFYTQAVYERTHPKQGMLVIRGAAPVRVDGPLHPNYHLIVHVFNRATGSVVQDADVVMRYAALSGSADRATHVLPVVEMQAIGGGPLSTHYGNNVALRPGAYRVTVTVNRVATTAFTIEAR